jgi:hypothetical protein
MLNEVVTLSNGGWAGYGVSPERALKLTRRCIARIWPRSRSERAPRAARTRRVSRRVARTTSSRGDPPRPRSARSLTRAERDLLKQEIDRRVRQSLAGEQVADKAVYRAVAAWGEAGVVS